MTVLSISAVNTAITELVMARNDQNGEFAFQAAESGLELAMSQPVFDTGPPVILTQDIGDHDTVETVITYEGVTIVPDISFSLGSGNGLAAHHFRAVSTAASSQAKADGTDRIASAVHSQGFYVVGPESPVL